MGGNEANEREMALLRTSYEEQLQSYCDLCEYTDRIEDKVSKPGTCSRWGWFNKQTGETRQFFCGRRQCINESCKKMYHWRRVRLLDALVKEYGLNYFFTLTLDPSLDCGMCPWDRIPYVWSKFRHRMKRRTDGLKFVAVLECHKNGRPHIHGFWDRFMSWEMIKEQWSGAGAGAGVWLEEVKTSDVASYVSKQLEVAKYVGKEQLVTVPPNVKRTLWRSTNTKASFEVKSKDLTKESDWCIIKEHIYDSNGKLKGGLAYG